MDKTKIYTERINKVIDYIESNLENKINLEELARVACFSKYHMHRIFYSFTNEPLYGFINRLRIERAAALLLVQKKTVTDIAFSCGFNDSATFSRAFKKHFKISATEWKKNRNSKINQDHRRKVLYNPDSDTGIIEKPAIIEEKQLKDMTIAYIRHMGSYAGNIRLFASLNKKLMKWAVPKGIVNYPATKHIIICHDPVGITDEKKLRISVGITAPKNVQVKGDIGKLHIPGGRYIICGFKLKNDEYGKAWNAVYRKLLPQRGLQPDDGYCFEMYSHDSYNEENDTTAVDICIPVKRL